jgi:hypothetical protein
MRGDDVHMTLRALRLVLAAIVVFAVALPATGLAATADVTNDRGVVQSVVGSGQIVLRALDGSVESFAVSAKTRVKLNGVRVSLAEIKPGFVATVVHNGSAPAVLIRAFGKPVVVTDRGVVTALTKSAITLRTAGGAVVIVSLDPNTRFRFLGLPAKRFRARPGAVVAVKHAAGAPATVVNVLKRAGA